MTKLINVNKEELLEYLKYNYKNLSETVSGDLSDLLITILSNLIEEYDCKSTLEKTLCEVIVNSYGKIISISKKLNTNLEFKYFSNERNGFLNILSKELDRANRNYIIALNSLLEIKRPKMNIKVNTKNIYLSEKQQFNNLNNKKGKH